MASEMTWRKAIDKILASTSTALHYTDISERIISAGYRKNLGATPSSTVNAIIAASIKQNGDASPYIRVDKGTFALRDRKNAATTPGKLAPTVAESSDTEDQYDIVTSFGMFWRKDEVEWTSTPKLLGMQQIGATPVNFNKQLGIYLLYDGREVIYVGRTTDRPLGKRLYEHTHDRLSSRWNRFSWFGLLPVNNDGQLGDLPECYVAAKIIPALEAILIEALEPRQNRKRGDDLAAVEYLQKIDPEIEKERLRANFAKALERR